MKYRMYVDEVGHASHKSCQDELYRYLSLTGIIMELGYVKDVAAPALVDLKANVFDPHPDDPIILHRNEILRRRGAFSCLRDDTKCREFDERLMALLTDLEYSVVTVLIDKQEQLERYKVWRHDPYHYAMQVLLERYVSFLDGLKVRGDVLAESRGGREDLRLKASFQRVWEQGTDFVEAVRFQAALTSKELKVKLKASNVAGLQLADLIAYPSRKGLLLEKADGENPRDFGTKVLDILYQSKYLRSPRGKIDGWGTKWLP